MERFIIPQTHHVLPCLCAFAHAVPSSQDALPLHHLANPNLSFEVSSDVLLLGKSPPAVPGERVTHSLNPRS